MRAGGGVIGSLALDLRVEFPEMTGFSRSNLQYMRAFAEAWPLGRVDVYVRHAAGGRAQRASRRGKLAAALDWAGKSTAD